MKLVDADYVAVVKNDDKILKQVVSALTNSNQLSVQIRQGLPGKAFVFIRANASSLLKLEYKERSRNWLNDIPMSLKSKPTESDRLRVIYDAISNDSKILKIEGVESVFPVAKAVEANKLVLKLSSKLMIGEDDIQVIHDEYGSKVAMYFAFVQYYFRWSLIPAVIGASTQYLLGSYSWLYTISNLLWAITFIHGWSRRQEQLSILWGDKNVSQSNEVIRDKFTGVEVQDPITGDKILYYPSWKRIIKQLTFIPVAIISCLILATFQTLVFALEIFLAQVYDGPGKSILGLVPTFLLVGLVPFFVKFYGKIVSFTSSWENHSTDTSYDESFGQKMFVFQFLTGFMALFLTTYAYLPFGHLIVPHLDFIRTNVVALSGRQIAIAHSFEINTARLRTQTIYMSVTAQVISLLTELVVPFTLRFVFGQVTKYSGTKVSYNDSPEEAKFLDDVRRQSKLPVYNVSEDYRQLTIQFGYSLLFSPVWQYAPVAAAIFNWLQLRGDLTKVVLGSKRPIPERVESIGPWIKNLKVLTWLASITAPSVVAMFGSSFSPPFSVDNEKVAAVLPGIVTISPRVLLATVLLSEHVYFLANAVVSAFFRALPSAAVIDFKRNGYNVRKKVLATQVPEPNVGIALKESDWPVLQGSVLEVQITESTVPPKTLKDKKNE